MPAPPPESEPAMVSATGGFTVGPPRWCRERHVLSDRVGGRASPRPSRRRRRRRPRGMPATSAGRTPPSAYAGGPAAAQRRRGRPARAADRSRAWTGWGTPARRSRSRSLRRRPRPPRRASWQDRPTSAGRRRRARRRAAARCTPPGDACMAARPATISLPPAGVRMPASSLAKRRPARRPAGPSRGARRPARPPSTAAATVTASGPAHWLRSVSTSSRGQRHSVGQAGVLGGRLGVPAARDPARAVARAGRRPPRAASPAPSARGRGPGSPPRPAAPRRSPAPSPAPRRTPCPCRRPGSPARRPVSRISEMLCGLRMPRPLPIGEPSGITAAQPASASRRAVIGSSLVYGSTVKPSATSCSAASSSSTGSGSRVRSSPITSSLTQSVSNASRASWAVQHRLAGGDSSRRCSAAAARRSRSRTSSERAAGGRLDPAQRDRDQLGAGGGDGPLQHVEAGHAAGAEDQARRRRSPRPAIERIVGRRSIGHGLTRPPPRRGSRRVALGQRGGRPIGCAGPPRRCGPPRRGAASVRAATRSATVTAGATSTVCAVDGSAVIGSSRPGRTAAAKARPPRAPVGQQVGDRVARSTGVSSTPLRWCPVASTRPGSSDGPSSGALSGVPGRHRASVSTSSSSATPGTTSMASRSSVVHAAGGDRRVEARLLDGRADDQPVRAVAARGRRCWPRTSARTVPVEQARRRAAAGSGP